MQRSSQAKLELGSQYTDLSVNLRKPMITEWYCEFGGHPSVYTFRLRSRQSINLSEAWQKQTASPTSSLLFICLKPLIHLEFTGRHLHDQQLCAAASKSLSSDRWCPVRLCDFVISRSLYLVPFCLRLQILPTTSSQHLDFSRRLCGNQVQWHPRTSKWTRRWTWMWESLLHLTVSL